MAAQPDFSQNHEPGVDSAELRLEDRLCQVVWPEPPDVHVDPPIDLWRRHVSGELPALPHRRITGTHRRARSYELGALIEAAAMSNDDARAELHRRYESRVLSLLRRATKDGHEAEDLAQGAFERAFAALSRSPDEAPSADAFWPWLRRIAVNHLINHLNRRRRIDVLDPAAVVLRLDARDHAPAPDVGWITDRALEASIGRLSDRERQVITLRYRGGLAFSEIAELLEATENTVYVTHSRALARLEQRWLSDRTGQRRELRLPATARPRRRRAASGITLLPPTWSRTPAWGAAGRGF